MLDPTRPAETLAYLLALHAEQPSIEFKRLGSKVLEKVAIAACAFANGDGGWIVIGLADPKEAVKASGDRIFGIQENPEGFDQLRQSLGSHFSPALQLKYHFLACTLHNGKPGELCLIRVEPSASVHSIHAGGTWIRDTASCRQLSAAETAELVLRRGSRSAESDLLPVPLSHLDTETWREFVRERGIRSGDIGEQLTRIGLAETVDGPMGKVIHPRRAAVLLFAEDPGDILAAYGTRAEIRFMVYSGKEAGTDTTPNFARAARTLRGPLVALIARTREAVLSEISRGVVIAGSGFRKNHKYPERVVTEAIVNAVIHRDYRLNRDIFVKMFDDKIVVEVPGALFGRITPVNIKTSGSHARNPLIVKNLREFPIAPNIDAGEGVPMMYDEMQAAKLYPPQYVERLMGSVEILELTLFNEERHSAWTEVSDWIDRHGPIANAKVCEIAKVDTLRASKMLKGWVDLGYLTPLEGRGRRNAAYEKPKASLS